MSSSSSSQILCVGPFEFPTASILLTREGGGVELEYWNMDICLSVKPFPREHKYRGFPTGSN